MTDFTFEFEQDRSNARKLMAYLSKAEGYGEDENTVWACNELRDHMREHISSLQPEMPDKIASVVLAPLHRDDIGLVEWVYDGASKWHHNHVERYWDDLDVYEIVRVGADVSDQQHLRRRISGLVGVILEAHDRTRSGPNSRYTEETAETIKSHYLLQVQFMEEMLREIDPAYQFRGPTSRGNVKVPIEMEPTWP